MSTPEEQQQQRSQQQPPQDPYGTQTWQADTWDTGYQPVHPPLGSVPGQPVAPEGWFREEAAAPGAGFVPGQAEAYPAYPGQGQGQPPAGVPAEGPAWGAPATGPQPQAPAPEGWFRDEAPAAPAPAPSPYPAASPVHDWSQGGQGGQGGQGAAAGSAAEQTAYLPPYPGPEQQQAVAPEGWFRDEAPAAPAQDWSQGGQGAAAGSGAAEQTAYLPPYPGPGLEQGGAAEQTAYLPPYPGPGLEQGGAAEQTAYLPPYPGPGLEQGGAAEETRGHRPAAAGGLPPHAAADPAPASAPAGNAADAPGAEWSPPTLAGNTLRAVDPAQARAEGRSPIIDPGPQSAILTAALGLLLAAAAALGQFALLVPLIALQGLTAAGWFRLNGMWPARQGIALAFAGALAADAAVLAVAQAHGAGAIVGTLGAWVLLTLVLQLRSQADPDERMYGLMASVASAALAVICAGYLAADTAAVTVGAAAVAVAVFVRALPLPTAPSVGVSLASAAGAGVAVGGITSVGVGGALLGLAAGVCALVGLRVAAYDYPSKFVHMTAGVALPLAAAAPAVYLIGRVVG
ncbi:hypothetical protein [Streptomyces sp. IMTB 1903]|uniref:hypothetical protein n=1 Tax=Streptomyces sp. IMTB 1903 TaxID=1776680 RepID=UPI00075EE1AE|nr:hypothetical protein [Streptomyces sp. IMTB 1903]